jgi:multidrug efflux pump
MATPDTARKRTRLHEWGVNLSAPFIARPVGTDAAHARAGAGGAPPRFASCRCRRCRKVDFPTISCQASLPGASPETMAATVATPLERSLGRIAGVTEMTSSSSLGRPA